MKEKHNIQKLMRDQIRFLILLAGIVGTLQTAKAKDDAPAKWNLNGYVSNMQSVLFQDINKDWVNDQLIHNRLNLHWYPHKHFTGSLQIRNRLIFGDQVRFSPEYSSSFHADPGWVDLTRNIAKGNSFILNSTIDRLWTRYTNNKLEITLGRQRINWGQSYVWNPNDLFNTYSFFDFDYPERPGSDALRITYHTGFTSSLEGVIKIDHLNQITAAGIWRFNTRGYDLQLLSGIYREEDYMLGAGWSGHIKNIGFRGEASYFHPVTRSMDTTGTVSISLSGDYAFKNNLFLQAEVLYNPLPGNKKISGFNDLYLLSLSPKTLSFTAWNVFAMASYPITPLFNTGIATIYYPAIQAFFMGPNLSYSLRDDLEISLNTQSFAGQFRMPDKTGQEKNKHIQYHLLFLRVKWNF